MVQHFVGDTHKVMTALNYCHLSFYFAGTNRTGTFNDLFWRFSQRSHKMCYPFQISNLWICTQLVCSSVGTIFCTGVRVRCLKGIIGYCVDDVSEQLDLWNPF
jgi:hypothetical protein